MNQLRSWIVPVLAGGLLLLLAAFAVAQGEQKSYLPIASRSEAPTPTPIPQPPTPPPGHMVEFRGLWITRFDWMGGSRPATPETVDRMVNDAANAGFNVLLFQARGEADAYYDSDLVPWGKRLPNGLGQAPTPYWDPLAHMILRAHERGLQVHAYINVYPVWLGPVLPSEDVSPRHLYYLLGDVHNYTQPEGGPRKNNGLQWDSNRNVIAGTVQYPLYLRASPASEFLDNHLLEVIHELVTNYALDGLHLDHARYAQSNYSCDPVSEASFGGPCTSPGYGDWQRRQINGTIWKFYQALFADPAWTAGRSVPFNLSAAVWPLYESGRNTYYQDSKAWIQGGYIDTLIPMIYSSNSAFDATVDDWRAQAKGFHDDRAGRFVFPGLGSNHYDSFAEIAGRIEASRSLGTQGHAIFSYGGLAERGYFDDLANGPYATPAVPPVIGWHP